MLYVPKKGIDMTQEEKEKYILNLFYSGVDYQEIAKRIDLSVDRVKKIICEKYNQK